MSRSWLRWSISVILLSPTVVPGLAHGEKVDNALSAEEKKDGWILLFDGKSLDGWLASSGKPSKVPVEDGCINPHGSGGYMMIHQKAWANFALSLDFKISKGCNSGVFIRTYPQLSIELNGELVTRMDLDQRTDPNRRPDGSEHKFDVAYKDHPRSGYIGLQDNGSPCWYKNIKIKPLARP